MNKIERFKEIVAEMATLYENKNKDYGDSFGKSIKEHGNIAGIVRMEDKFNRLKSLLNSNEKPNYESVSDTLTDLANYAIMMRIELEGKEGTTQKATQFECKVDADLSSLVGKIMTCPHKSLLEDGAESFAPDIGIFKEPFEDSDIIKEKILKSLANRFKEIADDIFCTIKF